MSKTPQNESLNDTIMDIAGYAVLAHLLETDQWNEKLLNPADGAAPLNKFFGEVIATFETKLADYGLKDMEEVGLAGVASRLTDKLARLKNLIKSEQHDLLVQQEGADGIHAPKKAGDCGYDLVCQIATTIPPRGQNTVDLSTGVKVKVPDGYWGLIVNRSSTPRKKQLMVMSGVIDSGYTGELFACVWNYSDQEVSVQPGERLAQLILIPATVRPLVPVLSLPSTERGETGFGSTNV